MFLNRIVMMKV